MNLSTAIDLSDDYASRITCNAMSVDVEDYFQVSAFDAVFPRSEWPGIPSRIEQNVAKVLRLFAEREAHATFFTLGCVAERFPQMIRAIADGGHEIASHGWAHHKVFTQTPEEFRDDVERTRKLLQDLSGQPVLGYRAASFSVDHRTPWAHAVLAEAGHTYSSSIYPVSHDHYGVPDAPRGPFRDGAQGILEIPASTIRRFGRNWPVAGGGFFRLYPLAASLWAIGQVNSGDRAAGSILLSPLGAGSGSATGQRHQSAHPLPSLSEPVSIRVAAWCAAESVSLGPHGQSFRNLLMSIHAAVAKIRAGELRAELDPVRTMRNEDRDRWDEFVRSNDKATFYHMSGWRHILENVLGHKTHYLLVERQGDIEGILPLGHVRSLLFGNALISVPFLVYGGPVASDA